MKLILLSLFILHSLSGLSQLTDNEVYDLKAGRVKEDTSYVYSLPYEPGKSCLLVQASNSTLSHKNELSADFKMKPGTLICAAREGLVIDLKYDSDIGGLKEANLADGNFIVIRHNDGSVAKYWHLQKDGVLVNLGDPVKKGQPIAKSGNTGYSAFPHLHFQVVDKTGRQLLTRFNTRKGVRYLRPGRWYRAVHTL
jgi:murein DD-endopeptidase MepM/ murein hydrolase activator NlpD